jgi:hypothetical protein
LLFIFDWSSWDLGSWRWRLSRLQSRGGVRCLSARCHALPLCAYINLTYGNLAFLTSSSHRLTPSLLLYSITVGEIVSRDWSSTFHIWCLYSYCVLRLKFSAVI